MTPEDSLVIMKVGFHGQEDLSQIVCRKAAELHTHGVCFWGYGGTVCHPTKAILPYISSLPASNRGIHAYFVVTPSPFVSTQGDASEYSVDGINWKPIQSSVRVSASRYALVLDAIEECDIEVNLRDYRVAIGPSMGRTLDLYLVGRVDKAIAVYNPSGSTDRITLRARFRARLASPYAILLRQ